MNMNKCLKALLALIVSLCTFAISLAVVPIFMAILTLVVLICLASYIIKLSVKFVNAYD